MSYNGSGTFNINSAGQPVVSGTVISSTAFNALTSDLATGLTTALTKDGQTTPTANITLGGYKITNLAAGTAAADAVRFDQLTSAGVPLITVAGTANAITGTITPSLTVYTTGGVFSFVVGSTNTAAVTLNIDGVGVKSVTRTGSVALVAGDMVAGQVVLVEYDGTRFQLLNGNSFTNLNVSGTLGVTGLTTLGVTGAVFPGSSSGTATIVAPAVAGTPTLTLPTVTGTISLINPGVNQMRLSLVTATPVTTTDQTAKTTVYLTPYTAKTIAVYSGSAWVQFFQSEISVAVPANTNTPFDVFIDYNSGTPSLVATAWTNDTTRATALTTQDGVLVKSGTLTSRYLGTGRTTGSSGQTEDSLANRYLWNYYNRVTRSCLTTFSADRTTTSTSYTEINTEIRAGLVIGVSEDAVLGSITGAAGNNISASYCSTGLAFDSTTTIEANFETIAANNTGVGAPIGISSSKLGIAVGGHYATLLGRVNANTGQWFSSSTNGGKAKVYLNLNIRG